MLFLNLRAERPQALQMQINGPKPDLAPAGIGEIRLSEAREHRIFLESVSGMAPAAAPAESTINSRPSRAALQPKLSSTRLILRTSDRSGHPESLICPRTSIHAAISGSTAFFAP